jgi:hypothetical protein
MTNGLTGTRNGWSMWRFAIIATFLQVTLSSASALECPAPQPLTRPGILKETPTQIHALSNLLESGDGENRIALTVADLRARYPGIENAEIVNYLMTAECPVVAKLERLGEQEKRARLDRFAGETAKIVYRHDAFPTALKPTNGTP